MNPRHLHGKLSVAAGEADGSVAGAVNATGDVLRAAFWAIGPAPEVISDYLGAVKDAANDWTLGWTYREPFTALMPYLFQ